MTNSGLSSNFSSRFNAFVAKAGAVAAILLCPLLFQPLFATGALRANEHNGLYIAAAGLFLISGLLYYYRHKGTRFALVFFTLLIFLYAEVLVRFSLKVLSSPAKIKSLNEKCNWTYSGTKVYQGHPFFQFTGIPSAKLKGNEALSQKRPFNNFGFPGADFHYEKTPGVTRIACLGESTTADGYPYFLESWLNRQDPAHKFEVMNFGQGYWTTNHSVVNFMLNVVDFHPDVIVIHHGWNEEKIRNVPPAEFRGDYSHAFKVFSNTVVYDRYLIRTSVIYRMLKFSYDQAPAWTTLQGSVQYPRHETDAKFSNLDELKPYRRNLENIIEVALYRKIRVVLTTLPHSSDSKIPMYYGHTSIDQCNAINREIAAEYGNKITFVDLDSMITGKHNEIFKDLGHVTDAGREMKAEAIGTAIVGIPDK